MPNIKRNNEEKNVDKNHLRSLSLSAGKTKAKNCQIIIGEVAHTLVQNAILNLVVKLSNGLNAKSLPPPLDRSGRYGTIGFIKKLAILGAAT